MLSGALSAIPMAMVSGKILLHQMIPQSLSLTGVGWVNFSGTISWVLLGVMLFTSLFSQRMKHYRRFLVLHLLLFPLVR